MSWVEVKHALNQTLGTQDFKPLDRIINDALYKSYYNIISTYEDVYGTNNGQILIIPKGTKETTQGQYEHGTFSKALLPPGMEKIDHDTFFECEHLNEIIIPDGVTYIGTHAFFNCTSLKHIEIPDTVTHIGSGAFAGTDYQNDISNWEDGSVFYIGKHLIEANSNIPPHYVIKDGTLTIAYGAFWPRTELESVVIPRSVRTINRGAFDGCTSLENVYYEGTQEQWQQIEIVQTENAPLLNATIHYNYTGN